MQTANDSESPSGIPANTFLDLDVAVTMETLFC